MDPCNDCQNAAELSDGKWICLLSSKLDQGGNPFLAEINQDTAWRDCAGYIDTEKAMSEKFDEDDCPCEECLNAGKMGDGNWLCLARTDLLKIGFVLKKDYSEFCELYWDPEEDDYAGDWNEEDGVGEEEDE